MRRQPIQFFVYLFDDKLKVYTMRCREREVVSSLRVGEFSMTAGGGFLNDR